jgi:hypothetical protein
MVMRPVWHVIISVAAEAFAGDLLSYAEIAPFGATT